MDPMHMDEQSQDDQPEPIYNSSVPIQDRSLEDLPGAMANREGSGKSVQVA